MLLLDTNVLSEFMRLRPAEVVVAWLDARIVAARTRAGRPVGVEDAQIAAIAQVRGLRLATRNVPDFLSIEGLTVVDPWQAGLL